MDELLVLGIKNKNEKAFEKTFIKYKNLVYFVAMSISGDTEFSEDIVQDTFISIYNKIDQFNTGNFKAWILKIAKNLTINSLKKEKNVIQLDETSAYLSLATNDECKDIFYDLRKILSYEEFTVLILSSVYNLKHKDIALYLDKPVGTVSWLYHEAKNKAKEFLERK